MEIKMWREILTPYDQAVKEILVKIKHLISEYRDTGLYCPIERVEGRVKKISSILDKAQKKHLDLDEIEDQIADIAGIRIICQFVEDIEKVVEMIRSRKDMKVCEEKDYITNRKESGYRSYHMIVMYHVETLSESRDIKVEIQIRTMAMNFWATIEHSLQYKYQANMPVHIREKLQNAAEAILVLDQEMASVRSEIMDAQNSFQIQANLVADILNTIQNLYQMANKRDILKIQDEFYKVYQMKDLEQLKRFHKHLDSVAEGYKAQAL